MRTEACMCGSTLSGFYYMGYGGKWSWDRIYSLSCCMQQVQQVSSVNLCKVESTFPQTVSQKVLKVLSKVVPCGKVILWCERPYLCTAPFLLLYQHQLSSYLTVTKVSHAQHHNLK